MGRAAERTAEREGDADDGDTLGGGGRAPDGGTLPPSPPSMREGGTYWTTAAGPQLPAPFLQGSAPTMTCTTECRLPPARSCTGSAADVLVNCSPTARSHQGLHGAARRWRERRSGLRSLRPTGTTATHLAGWSADRDDCTRHRRRLGGAVHFLREMDDPKVSWARRRSTGTTSIWNCLHRRGRRQQR